MVDKQYQSELIKVVHTYRIVYEEKTGRKEAIKAAKDGVYEVSGFGIDGYYRATRLKKSRILKEK